MPAFSARVRETIYFSRSSCRLLPITTTRALSIKPTLDRPPASQQRPQPTVTNEPDGIRRRAEHAGLATFAIREIRTGR
jgi:hypothetical protein